MDLADRLNVLVSILALYLLLSVVGGLGEPGPIFEPADVDLVFPAPFRRRDVLVYHLVRHYLQMLLLALFYGVFLGAPLMPNPVWTYVGIALCLFVCTQLQTAMMLAAASVSERVFGRLRFVTRLLLVGLVGMAALVAVGGAAGAGDVPALLEGVLATTVAQVLLYPAVAVGRLAVAPGPAEIALSLFGLLAVVAGSFGFVLLFPVNFLETAATRAERKRRASGGREGRARSLSAAHSLFSGAGALGWLNLVTLRRRLRMVVGALVMLLVMMLFAGVRSDSRTPTDLPTILVLLVFYPLFVQVPLGFKGHRQHLEQLKTLPMRPWRVAWGEVAMPAVLLFALQIAIVGVFVGVGSLEAHWLAIAAVVYPAVDVGVVALSDLFQLGKDRRQLGFLLVTAQMFAMAVSLVPAFVVGAVVLVETGDVRYAVLAGVLAHVFVDFLLLRLLGRRFARWEPGD